MDETNYSIAAYKLIEAARILLDTQDGNPYLRAIRIASEINVLALEALAISADEKE